METTEDLIAQAKVTAEDASNLVIPVTLMRPEMNDAERGGWFIFNLALFFVRVTAIYFILPWIFPAITFTYLGCMGLTFLFFLFFDTVLFKPNWETREGLIWRKTQEIYREIVKEKKERQDIIKEAFQKK